MILYEWYTFDRHELFYEAYYDPEGINNALLFMNSVTKNQFDYELLKEITKNETVMDLKTRSSQKVCKV